MELVKSMTTVQTILSLHELMIALTTKDRDKYIARAFLGKQTAGVIDNVKQHDILAMNSIISAFAEIAAIIVISVYLYVFVNGQSWERIYRFSKVLRVPKRSTLIAIGTIVAFDCVRPTAVPRHAHIKACFRKLRRNKKEFKERKGRKEAMVRGRSWVSRTAPVRILRVHMGGCHACP